MDWKSFLSDTKKSFANLNKNIPETFNGFNHMGKEAKKDGELSEKTKEFIALGIAIATRCCLLYTSPSPRDGLLSRMPSSA